MQCGTKTILNQMMNCICKLKINKTNGTGFFCQIPYDNNTMNVLMTNYHVLDENYFKEKDELNLFINDEKDVKILDLKIQRKKYFNKDYDTTIIELKENDNINNYLELDDNLFKKEFKAFYSDISIYVLQYPLGNNAAVSYGLSSEINNYDIKHICSTEQGSSGSPILNLSNNKVIGIHKQGAKRFNYNMGTCLKFPLNDFMGKENLEFKNIKQENQENEMDKKYNEIINQYKQRSKELFEVLNDVINDTKYFIGPGPKMNIIFKDGRGPDFTIIVNYGTTIDQMLKIYLRRVGRKDLIGYNKSILFLFNAKKINPEDKTS